MVQIRPTHIRAFGLIARSAPEDILMLNIPTFRPIGGATFSPGSSARFARMNKKGFLVGGLATLYSLYEINIRTILEYVATEHPFSGSVETCAKRSLGVDYDYDGLWNYIYKDSGCLISLLFVLAQLSSFFLYLTT